MKPKHSPALLAITTSTLLISGWAKADDTAVLDDVTVTGAQSSYSEQSQDTALKMTTEALATPFSTSVINAGVLEDLKAYRLEDAYSYIAGFSRSGTSANAFTIRGMSTDLQNVQVDGLPGLVSRFGSPVTANIERVEVLKGPASVLYGWMDPSGLVNIITQKPQSSPETSLSVNAQTYPDQGKNGYQASVDTSNWLSNDGSLSYRLIAGYENTDSFRDYVSTEASYLFPSLSWQSDNTRLDVQLEYTKEERGADDGLFVANHDISTAAGIETYYQEPGDSDDDQGQALSVSLNHRFSDRLESTTRLRSVWHEDERDLYESNAVIEADEVADTSLRRRNRHQFNRREYHFIDTNLHATLGDEVVHDVLIGVNGGYEYRQYDRLAFDTRGAAVTLYDPQYTGQILADDPGNYRTWDLYSAGLYIADKITLSSHWTLLAGARYDRQAGDYHMEYKDADTTADESEAVADTTYNAGVVYRVNPGLSLYASYAESFSPQAIPTYDVNGEQMEPERGIQQEAGVKFESGDGRMNLNIAYFDTVKKNLAEEGPSGYDELIGEVSSQGAEITLQLQPLDHVQLQTGYTYTDAEISKAYENRDNTLGNPPASAPAHNAFALGRYNVPHPVLNGLVGVSLGYKYESERYTDEDSTTRVRLPGYSVVDCALYYERGQGKYALNVANLLNQEYYVSGSNNQSIDPGEPLKVSLSAKYTF
ncbi:TonB-dependent siderophore receptor [Thalassolituus sp. LLYu03]|uniref:TonB-dependent siderophore receptor n=1 Tax=Thalassolituus sp. LLYu03 TaxID=3421656 RepID=UPI003D27AE60